MTRVVLWVCPPKVELRPGFSEMKGKDTRRDFFLLDGVLEEGRVIEIGKGREGHAKDPGMYE